MPNYLQTEAPAQIYQRSFRIMIENPLVETPSVRFSEERVIKLDDEVIAKIPCGEVFKLLDDLTQRIPMINPATDMPLGTTMSYLDIYVVLYSSYRFLANLRDTLEPTFSLHSMGSQPEGDSGNTTFTFVVNFHGNDGSHTGSVDWAVTGTGDHPADADDFGGTFPSGTLTFGLNDFFKFITISVSGDTAVELDETFKVTLSNPQGADIFPDHTEAIATITNDDTGE